MEEGCLPYGERKWTAWRTLPIGREHRGFMRWQRRGDSKEQQETTSPKAIVVPWQVIEYTTYPVSVPFGTPVTNVGLHTSNEYMHSKADKTGVHHSHRLVIFAQPELKIFQELGGDAHEIILAQAELLFNLFEDAMCILGGGPVVR